MKGAEKIVQMLQTYGAWGMVVILLFAVWGLWRYSCKVLEQRHVEIMTILEETTKAMAATAQGLERSSELQKKSAEIMEKAQQSNAAMTQVIQFCQSRQKPL